MTEKNLTKMLNRISLWKHRISPITTFIEKANGSDVSEFEISSRIQVIDKMYEDYETKLGFFIDSVDEVNDNLELAITELEELLQSTRAALLALSSKDPAHECSTNNVNEDVSVPKVHIPTFNGNPNDWINFKKIFEKVIHFNPQIKSGVIKFTHLLKYVEGDARDIIGTIVLSSKGYEQAWQELNMRYNNSRILINIHIESLLNLSSNLSIKDLLNKLVCHTSALKACDQKLDTLSEMFIINCIVRCFNPLLRKDWENELSSKELPTVQLLKIFLTDKVQLNEILSVSKSSVVSSIREKKQYKPSTAIQNNRKPTVLSSYISTDDNSSANRKVCVICNQPFHKFSECQVFLRKTTRERYDVVKKLNLCVNCFSAKHYTRECTNRKCHICQRPHNTLLHHKIIQTKVENNPPVNNTIVSTDSLNVNDTPTTSTFCLQQPENVRQVFLSTALVQIRDRHGHIHEARALLDSASQSNFMTQSFANKIGLNRQSVSDLNISSLNNNQTKVSESISTEISSIVSSFRMSCNFLLVPLIANALPQKNINISHWNIPQHVKLADPFFNIALPIDILLGAETFVYILRQEQHQITSHLPLLQNTTLGWIISGVYTPKTKSLETYPNKKPTIFSYSTFTDTESLELKNSIQRFWELETIPEQVHRAESDAQCEKLFQQSTSRNSEGRFVVSLPFTENLCKLGISKSIAFKRFSSLEKALNSDSDIKKEYVNFMNEYLDLGHMKLVQDELDPPNHSTYYMPHHAVLKPHSSSTKLRVVFDASSKTTGGLSLNEVMCKGPVVQEDLLNIVLRFRKHAYAFTADISKMYRQILVNPSQTQYQRILWRSDSTQPIQCFELNTVTYGTTAAPYLATRCLIQLSQENINKFPLGATALKEDFYVDDVLSGANTKEKAIELQTQLVDILNQGKFELHKWCSNEPSILEQIPIEKREILKFNSFSNRESISTLGVRWEPNTDEFTFHIPELTSKNNIITKRLILKKILKIYDPMGLLGPVIVIAKLIIQELWKLKIDWDDEIPQELQNSWLTFEAQLVLLNDIHIPRCIILSGVREFELHGFADASQKAYGSCFYIKNICFDGSVSTFLLCAKSRVAPVKFVTLPRLELCAAQLTSKLLKFVLNAMKTSFHKIYLWSDSQIVLKWITISPHLLKTFIANRVNEIQENTKLCKWQYIPSKSNPADFLSRGTMPAKIKNLKEWWNGPNFLNENIQINYFPLTDDIEETLLELRPTKPLNFVQLDVQFNLIEKFSSYNKLLRIVAYCKRFMYNCKNTPKRYGVITSTELNTALKCILRIVQRDEFKNEIKTLSENKSISKSSKLYSLNVFLDDDKILRVGGRLENSKLIYDSKHQFILPHHNHFTKLVFEEEHRKNFHVGVSSLISFVRKRFWPINAKSIAKRICRNCVSCFKVHPKLQTQLMGNLPQERLVPQKPFLTTGIDLCGPIYIKYRHLRNSQPQKVFIALFICFVSKAIHIEILFDLSATSFLYCLKRFLSRRGKCSTIWTDNAGNFVGCKNALKQFYDLFKSEVIDNQILRFCSQEQIEWRFIPPRSPSFGGLWESNIKSLKTHLKRSFSNKLMSFEELHTSLIQIEGIINSRPLTIISDDPKDPEPLTPAHFLTGGTILMPVEPNNYPNNKFLKWKNVYEIIHSFWKRYSMEHLHTLQQRQKWQSQSVNVSIGDIVLIADENLPSTRWLLGKIINIYPGNDGRVRVVDIKASTGIFKRGINKIAKLPISQD